MQSRMDKYENKEQQNYERSRKNTKLYEEVYDDIYRDTTYKNMQVIDTAKEINLNKLKDMINDNYDTRQYRTFKNYDLEDVDVLQRHITEPKRQKSYDINEIINEAKSKRSFIEEAKEKQKFMDFSKRRNFRYDDKYEKIEKEEKELEDLINTMAIPKKEDTNDALDLLEDLKGEENTVVSKPIEASFDIENTSTKPVKDGIDKTLVKADKTFYTGSNMFTKNDFEDFSTLTKELSKSNNKKRIIVVAVVVVIILLIIGIYLLVTNFVIK